MPGQYYEQLEVCRVFRHDIRRTVTEWTTSCSLRSRTIRPRSTGRGVLPRAHRLRPAHREQCVHARAGDRRLGRRHHAGHHRRQPGLRRGALSRAGPARRHHPCGGAARRRRAHHLRRRPVRRLLAAVRAGAATVDGAGLQLCRHGEPRRRRGRDHAEDEADLGRDSDQSADETGRHRRLVEDREGAWPAADRRQHLRHPLESAAAEAGGRRGYAFGDQIPERPLRHHRRGAGDGDPELAKEIKFLQNSVGGVMGPFDAFLANRGLKTLGLRMKAHNENALAVARWLEDRKGIAKVIYPGLISLPQHELASRQMNGRYGGMVTALIDGDLERTKRVLERVQVFTLAESLGRVETLVNHPA